MPLKICARRGRRPKEFDHEADSEATPGSLAVQRRRQPVPAGAGAGAAALAASVSVAPLS